MDDKKMEIIQQLMDELQEQMKPDENDFSSRLGRKKPDVAVMKVEGDMDPDMDHDDDSMMGTDSDDDLSDPMDPQEKLKQRLMKLRG